MNLDLKKASTKDLKVLAYDLNTLINQYSQTLQQVNNEVANRNYSLATENVAKDPAKPAEPAAAEAAAKPAKRTRKPKNAA